jgi:hypothetical protein
MKIKLLLYGFITLNFLTRISAQEVTGFLYDSESKNGVPGVNVYWEKAPARGTITNEDGKFVLISTDSCNILVISHIGYQSVRYEINAEESINVGLMKATHQIAGVTVKPLDPDFVMKNVVEQLDENHPSGSVLYDFFHREVYYSKDSLIHIIEQHVGTVEHKKNGLRRFTNKINLRKSELNYLSKEGRKKSKEVRFMGLSQILWDNPHFDSPMFLKRRSLKDFEFTYFGKQFIKDRVCHVLHYKTSKPCQFSEGTLYLDFDSYGIVSMTMQNQKGTESKQVNFVHIDGQWLLNSVSLYKNRKAGLSYRTTLYNKAIDERIDSRYTTIGKLLPLYVRDKSTHLNKPINGEINIIPLPEWMSRQL